MIINEFKRLIARPQANFLLLFIILSFLLSGLNIPSDREYNDIYNTYAKNSDQFIVDNEKQLVAYSESSSYFYYQVKYVNERSEKNNDKVAQILAKKETGLFDSYIDQKRLDKELAFYKEVSKEVIEIEDTYRIDKILNDNTFRLLTPILSALLIMLIFSEDIENESLSLFKTTKKSLAKLFVVKSFVYLMLMVLIMVLLVLVTSFKTGFSTIPIHSMVKFKEVMGNYSVSNYIIKESLYLLINSLILGYGLISLFIVFKNQAVAFIAIITLYFVEAILYLTIPITSALVYFKYFNIFYITFIYRQQFLHISSGLNFFIIITLVITLICAYVLYKIYKRWNLSISKGLSLKTTDLLLQSTYQLFINYRGIVMVALVLLFSFYNIQGFSLTTRFDEQSYNQFKENYLGEITHDLENRINEDDLLITEAYSESLVLKDYIDKHSSEASELYAENDHVFQLAKNYNNVKRLKAELDEAKELKVEALVDTRGTDLIFMKGQKLFLLQHLLVLILPILVFGFYQAIHSFSKESLALVNSSKSGFRLYLRFQSLAIFFLSFLSVFIIMTLHLFKIFSNVPVNLTSSLKQQMIINIDISLWIGLLFIYLLLSLLITTIGIFAQRIGNKIVNN